MSNIKKYTILSLCFLGEQFLFSFALVLGIITVFSAGFGIFALMAGGFRLIDKSSLIVSDIHPITMILFGGALSSLSVVLFCITGKVVLFSIKGFGFISKIRFPKETGDKDEKT